MRLWQFGRLRGSKIKIKEEIGRRLGLVDGSQVFSTMFRYDHNGSSSYEIVLSTFGPENYRQICSATFYMVDKPGACAQVSQFLGEKNIDILNSVSLSVISSVCMVWKMLVDLSYYGEPEALKAEFDQLKRTGSSKLEKVDAIDLEVSHISDRYTKGAAPISSSVRTRAVRAKKGSSRIVDGEFQIPDDYMRSLSGVEDGQPLMMVGDTESWVLSITFLNQDARLLGIKLIIPDRPGAISDVTGLLASHNINLVAVHTKVLVYYESMELEVVADISKTDADGEWLRSSLIDWISKQKGRYSLTSFHPVEL